MKTRREAISFSQLRPQMFWVRNVWVSTFPAFLESRRSSLYSIGVRCSSWLPRYQFNFNVNTADRKPFRAPIRGVFLRRYFATRPFCCFLRKQSTNIWESYCIPISNRAGISVQNSAALNHGTIPLSPPAHQQKAGFSGKMVPIFAENSKIHQQGNKISCRFCAV